jgi:uncharacterized membrane protein YhaH (DUF805 family)
MKGNVIGFDPDTNTGAITGYDGNRYNFVMLDWRASGRPRSGDLVDFQAVDQRATEIYLLEAQYVAPNFGQFYFSPSGRISRSQYWLRFMLPYMVVVFITEIMLAISNKDSGIYIAANVIMTIFYLIVLWPSIAILVKRVHDRNRTGWTILWLFMPAMIFTIMLFVWLGAAIFSAAEGQTVSFSGPLGALGVLVIVLGLVVLGINIWFFVEFGCLRGTIGANKYGPDPVR